MKNNDDIVAKKNIASEEDKRFGLLMESYVESEKRNEYLEKMSIFLDDENMNGSADSVLIKKYIENNKKNINEGKKLVNEIIESSQNRRHFKDFNYNATVNQLMSKYTWLGLDEAIKSGIHNSFFRACKSYDYRKGAFKPYVSFHMGRSIGATLNKEGHIIRIPASTARDIAKLKDIISNLYNNNMPSTKELAVKMGVSEKRILNLLSYMGVKDTIYLDKNNIEGRPEPRDYLSSLDNTEAEAIERIEGTIEELDIGELINKLKDTNKELYDELSSLYFLKEKKSIEDIAQNRNYTEKDKIKIIGFLEEIQAKLFEK